MQQKFCGRDEKVECHWMVKRMDGILNLREGDDHGLAMKEGGVVA